MHSQNVFCTGARSRVTAGWCSVGAGAHMSAGLRAAALCPPKNRARPVATHMRLFLCVCFELRTFLSPYVVEKKMRGMISAGLWCVTPIYSPHPNPDPTYRGDIFGHCSSFLCHTVHPGHILNSTWYLIRNRNAGPGRILILGCGVLYSD